MVNSNLYLVIWIRQYRGLQDCRCTEGDYYLMSDMSIPETARFRRTVDTPPCRTSVNGAQALVQD